jgi:mono/diheme cytochrome c family protein
MMKSRRIDIHRSMLGAAAGVFLLTFVAVQARPQAAPAATTSPQLIQKGTIDTADKSGAELFKSHCSACHGLDGKGKDASVLGFDVPTPDFTDCQFAPREALADWVTVAHEGGPVRGFSQRMPSFGEALGEEGLTKIVTHIKTFCTATNWPNGELNLPKALHTEKAFPEDEWVWTTTFGRALATVGTEFVYEKRFGPRNQIEVKLPFEAARINSSWVGGAGDLTLGFKRAFAHSLDRGMIAALGGEIILPTGDESAGLSKGTPVFESFFSFGKLFAADAFLQFQGGVELPLDTHKAEREGFWRVALGKTWMERGGIGRSWTPMVEVLAGRELEGGAPTSWDIVPQMQVTLNTRQHIRFNLGWRTPLNDRRSRSSSFVMYFLWDWFDGGLRDGW